MNDTIFELKIKGIWIKADKEFLSISNKDGEIIKVSYQKLKDISLFVIAKVKEFADSSETKKLDK